MDIIIKKTSNTKLRALTPNEIFGPEIKMSSSLKLQARILAFLTTSASQKSIMTAIGIGLVSQID